jgi:hypothetical protein
VGPPGSGKSSLVRALLARKDRRYFAAALRGRVGWATVTRSAVWVALPFAAQFGRIPTRPWYRYRTMVQLGIHAAVLCGRRRAGEVAVLDQGPVYLLSILQRALRADGSDHRRFLRFWEATLGYWSRALDLVVVLDAPDEVLFERVKSRGTPHPLLGLDPASGLRVLGAGRRSRELILEQLSARNPSLTVERLDTQGLCAEALAERVAKCVDELGSTGSDEAHPCRSSARPLGAETH